MKHKIILIGCGIMAQQHSARFEAVADKVEITALVDIEIERANDFFLRDEVTYLMNTYGLSDEDYDKCYQTAKTREFLFTDSSAVLRNNEIKK